MGTGMALGDGTAESHDRTSLMVDSGSIADDDQSYADDRSVALTDSEYTTASIDRSVDDVRISEDVDWQIYTINWYEEEYSHDSQITLTPENTGSTDDSIGKQYVTLVDQETVAQKIGAPPFEGYATSVNRIEYSILWEEVNANEDEVNFYTRLGDVPFPQSNQYLSWGDPPWRDTNTMRTDYVVDRIYDTNEPGVDPGFSISASGENMKTRLIRADDKAVMSNPEWTIIMDDQHNYREIQDFSLTSQQLESMEGDLELTYDVSDVADESSSSVSLLVFVNGHRVDTTTSEGTHTVSVDPSQLQQSNTVSFEVPEGLESYSAGYTVDSIDLNAETNAQETLQVTSSPSGADVTIDGEHVGQTTWQDQIYGLDTYEVVVDADNYQSKTFSDVDPASVDELDADLEPQQETLSVTSAPDGADVYLDGTHVGTTPWSEDRPVTESYDITVDAANYHSKTRTSVTPGAEEHFDLEPQQETLSVTSSPTGANVYLDGNLVGATPWSGDRPVTDTYDIEVNADGYQSVTRTGVSPGSEEYFDLEPQRETISVTSAPENADVYLDGNRVGTTPWSGDRPVTDSYDIEVDADNYQSMTRTGVSPGAEEHFDLEPQEDTLSVTSSPTGADVYLDGNLVGTTPWSGDRPVTESYEITVDADDYQSVTRSGVTPGAEEYFDLEIEYGTLSVTSTPENADVYLDGTHVGTTPWSGDRPVTETYDIEVDADEYHSTTRTSVSPPADENITLDQIQDDPFFSIESVEATQSAEGGPVKVDVAITNTGDVSDAQTVSLEIDGLGSNSTSVSLDGGESTTETLSIPTGESDAGSYTATVESDNASESASITVLEQALFEVEIVDTNDPVEGGELEVTAKVENTGDVSETQTVELDVPGVGTDSTTLSLGAAESDTHTFTLPTESGDAGTYTASVSSDDGEDTVSVEVNSEPDEGYVAVEIGDTNDPVTEGEVLEIDATVENTGESPATQTVTFTVGNETVATEPVQLASSGSRSLTFTHRVDRDDDGTDVRVASENDSATRTLTVDATETPATYELSGLTPTDTAVGVGGDPIDVSATVENTGTESGVQDLEMQVVASDTGTVVFEGTAANVSLAGKANETVAFDGVPAGDFDPGTYTYAVSSDNDSINGTLTVTEGHPSGVDQGVWDAVTGQNGASGDLSFQDLVDAIQAYQADGVVDQTEIAFQDLVDLIQWYQEEAQTSTQTTEMTIDSTNAESGAGEGVSLEHPANVSPDGRFNVTVETEDSAGTIVEFDPSGFDVELASDDAVTVENNRVEFLDVTAGNSTYTITADVIGGSDGDTGDIAAWTNAEQRAEADGEANTTFEIDGQDGGDQNDSDDGNQSGGDDGSQNDSDEQVRNEGERGLVSLEHPANVSQNGTFDVTVETEDSAGTVVEFAPNGSDVDLDLESGSAVTIEGNRVEYLDAAASNSTYTITVDVVNGSVGDTIDIDAWINAESREDADDNVTSTINIEGDRNGDDQNDTQRNAVSLEHPANVSPDGTFDVTVETEDSAGTVVEFAPNGFDVELSSDDAVAIDNGRVEFLDPTAGDSTYTISADVIGGSDGDLVDIAAWTNAQNRTDADAETVSAVNVGTDSGSAFFEVAINDDESNTQVTESEEMGVTATIENTGERAGVQPIAFATERNGVETTEIVHLETGESQDVWFTSDIQLADDGTDVTVSSENDSTSRTLTVSESEATTGLVDSLEHSGNVSPDGQFNVTVKTNASAGTTVEFDPDGFDVQLASDDALTIEDNRVKFLEPAAGNSSYTITVDVSGGADGDTLDIAAWVNAEQRADADDEMTGTLELGGENDGAENEGGDGGIVLPEPGSESPEFEVTINDVADEAAVGEELSIDVAVENVGDADGEREVTLALDGNVVQREDVQLGSGETAMISASAAIAESMAGQDVTVTAESEDDEATATVSVESSDNGPDAELVLDEVDFPTEADAGQSVAVTAVVGNAGEQSTSGTVTYAIDGTVVDETTVELGTDETTSVTLESTVPDGSAGETTQSLTVGDDNETGSLDVHDPRDDDLADDDGTDDESEVAYEVPGFGVAAAVIALLAAAVLRRQHGH